MNALKAVGANQRIALALNLLCDYDAKKIADVLKISEDKVQNSLDYGRENVKKQLRLSNGNFSKRDIVFLMTASSDIVKSAAAQKKLSDTADKAVDDIVLSLAKPQNRIKRKRGLQFQPLLFFLLLL